MAEKTMITTALKWISRCLGWIVLGCAALAALCGYALQKKIGYGGLEIRLTWRGKAYSLDQQRLASAEMQLGDRRVVWNAGMVMRLRPGPVTLQLAIPNFRRCSVATNVVKDVKTVAEFRLEAEPRRISVQNVISNAAINGQSCRGVWVITNAEVGRPYRVEATVPGYHTNLLTLQIGNPGEDLVTNLVWRPLIGFVSVKVTPVLSDTAVTIDGVRLGQDGVMSLGVGIHSLGVSNRDYYPWSQHVEVAHAVTNHCQFVLKPRPASLSVQVTPKVPYQLHDGSGKLLALEGGKIRLPPGTNILSITASGYDPTNREFELEPNREERPWRVSLQKPGLNRFQTIQREFEALSRANHALLDYYGGAEWAGIRDRRYDTNNLVLGAEQYGQAMAELGLLIPKCKSKDKERTVLLAQKTEFGKRVLDAAKQYPALEKCLDFEELKKAEFNSSDPAKSEEQCKQARDRLEEIIKTASQRQALLDNENQMYDKIVALKDLKSATRLVDNHQKQFGEGTQYAKWFGGVDSRVGDWIRTLQTEALRNSEQSMNKRISELIGWRVGDEKGWAQDLKSATQLVVEYEKQFGEGTQYDKLLGDGADRVRHWKREINYEWTLLPRKYRPTEK